jgi:hypothetical protein
MEELSAAEERADAEHQLAEVRRQEVNILKRPLRLRDEELADGCRHSMQDQLSDCPLQSIARVGIPCHSATYFYIVLLSRHARTPCLTV